MILDRSQENRTASSILLDRKTAINWTKGRVQIYELTLRENSFTSASSLLQARSNLTIPIQTLFWHTLVQDSWRFSKENSKHNRAIFFLLSFFI